MQPQNPAPLSSRPAAKNSTLRYVVSLFVLVAIVGGIAWIIQYLPNMNTVKQNVPIPDKATLILRFNRHVAQWGPKVPTQDKDDADHVIPSEVELGSSGHYDFPFKNVYAKDVEILGFSSNCNCNSVTATVLSPSAWEDAVKHQEAKFGEPIVYAPEPEWIDLPKLAGSLPGKGAVRIKPEEGGIVRVRWVASKKGPEFRLRPKIIMRRDGDPVDYEVEVNVPVVVRDPIQFDIERLRAGVVTPGKTLKREFDAWSATRSKIEFTFVSTDPLVTFTIKPLEKAELEEKTKDLRARKLAGKVMRAFTVTVTIHEAHAGKHLDQGSFYRKFPVALDGNMPDPNSTLYSPEIVGRMKGDIGIGGEDDQGRIRFAPFTRATGGAAEVQLSTSPNVKLEKYEGHGDQPSFLKVNLMREENQASPNRVTWLLEAIVPPNTPAARTFDEPDAVVLRIVGTDKLVRVPLEGQISR